MQSSLLSSDDPTYHEAEHFILTALNALSAHVAILDETGQILEVNDAWRQFARSNDFQQADYGVGMNYLLVCDRATIDDGQVVSAGIRAVIGEQQDEFWLEYTCHSSTERRWYVTRVTRFDWYGHVRLIVAHQNVTELKRVQVELEASHAHLEAILNHVVNGILTVSPQGQILSVNQAVTTIFGYVPEELIGEPLMLLLVETDDVNRMSSLVTENAAGHEIKGRRKDGTIFPMLIAMTEMKMGSETLYTSVVQDITARKLLEAEQMEKHRLEIALEKERELRQLKNRFISMMSHELKTPLASIRLASDFMKHYGDRATAEEKAESVEAIETQVQYLSEIVDDVTTISKIEFTGDDLNREVYDLETYLRDIIESLEWTHRKTHRLIYSGVDRRVESYIDRKLLRRAIVNLLSNAIKYSPDGGNVYLDLAVHDGVATIKVSDSGIGIPPEDLPRLFDAFHRAENVGKLPGTGLGLAIARQAIELHGGSISVDSTVDVGTTVTVMLPLNMSEA